MNFKFFGKKRSGLEYFWSLVIGKDRIDAAVWRIIGENVEIVGKSEGFSWQEDDADSLIEAADSALTAASSALPEEVEEPDKVVFGLCSSWVVDGEIKPENLKILKKLSETLELKPAGFVIMPEAIVYLLKSRDGAPPNAILVGVYDDELNIALVESGKVLGITDVARSISPGADIAEGLARFQKPAQYPARILLYDHKGGELDEVKQSVIETAWNEYGMKFLHTPRVEVLPSDVGISAVSLAGGAEVGHAKFLSTPQGGSLDSSERTDIDMAKGEQKILKGFEKDQHIKPSVESELEHETNLEEVAPEELGFVSDDTENVSISDKDQQSKVSQSGYKVDATQIAERTQSVSQRKSFHKLLLPFSLFRFHFPKLSFIAFPALSVPGGRTAVIGILLLAFLLVGGGLVYWFLPKASVSIYVSPRKIEKSLVLKLNPSLQSADIKSLALPGRFIRTEVSGQKTVPTTGTRLVGERATGEITIYRSGSSIILPAATIVISPKGLKFTLDAEVEVASGSAAAPGTSSVRVTASDIGPEYNLPAGTTFRIGKLSLDDIEGKSNSDFTGGTSREVASVSDDDKKNLTKILKEELLSKGKDNLKANLSEDEVLVQDFFDFKIKRQEFNHKVGDEADSLQLSMSGAVQQLVVSRENLQSIALEELSGEVPDDYTLSRDQIKIEIAKASDDKLSANISASLLPKVNTDKIKNEIAGKTPEEAKSYLASIPGFEKAKIVFAFRLPGLLGTLPRRLDNISIELIGSK